LETGDWRLVGKRRIRGLENLVDEDPLRSQPMVGSVHRHFLSPARRFGYLEEVVGGRENDEEGKV